MTPSTEMQSLLPNAGAFTDARRRLFEAAIDLFGARGFHAVSVRDLANQLGMAPGAIYAHVASKQDLLYELVVVGLEEHRSRLREALLGAGSDPSDQVRALTRAHVLVHLEFPALARVIHREVRSLSEEQTQAASLVTGDAQRIFTEVVERGVRLGSFAVDDSRLAVLAIAGMGIRAAEWWTSSDPLPAAAVADTYCDYALRILGV